MTYILAIVCSVVVLLADQITKFFVASNYSQLSNSFPLIKNIINFTYVENGGAAFGIFHNKKWLILAITIVIMIVCVGLLVKKAFNSKIMFWALCLVLSGGVGNMIDRIFRGGYVIDFIQFDFFKAFPVFNIADIAVSVGAGLIVLYFILDTIKEMRNNKRGKIIDIPEVDIDEK